MICSMHWYRYKRHSEAKDFSTKSEEEKKAILGVEKSTDGAGNKGWSQTAASFNDVLAILKESYGKSKKSKKAKTDKSAPAQTISVGMK
jgi:hypothetical protein